MIPVELQPEPIDFDARVRQPGLHWLAAKGIAIGEPLRRGTEIQDYWTRSSEQLWLAYGGVCAYLSIYFEWVIGASSTDHFLAKSKYPHQAYEWSNYRLSCLGANRNKHHFDDVLDPIGLQPNTFLLNLASGEIFPNPELDAATAVRASSTIHRLKLNSPSHKTMRQRQYRMYLQNKHPETLKFLSPFVWYEAQRQGLL
ncbi:hypothetical protein [Macromonas bipunctata]|uniref:hypothetical protein n=1 Tax=Macromonas bipunctata TaxID=183670 RepID=UPI000C320C00|nr:hypothetical protein [Macromonas bipunctata]